MVAINSALPPAGMVKLLLSKLRPEILLSVSHDAKNTTKALIIANPQVAGWKALREETQGDLGLFRYRITFHDGSLLEMFDWQDAAGGLLKRWDNAAHHPQVSTHPHHLHDGGEENVSSYEPLSAEQVLAMITSFSSE